MFVTGKLKRSRPSMVPHCQFQKSVVKKGTPKFTMPSPAMLHARGDRLKLQHVVAGQHHERLRRLERPTHRDLLIELPARGLHALRDALDRGGAVARRNVRDDLADLAAHVAGTTGVSSSPERATRTAASSARRADAVRSSRDMFTSAHHASPRPENLGKASERVHIVDGDVRDVHADMMHVTMEIVVRTLFGGANTHDVEIDVSARVVEVKSAAALLGRQPEVEWAQPNHLLVFRLEW